MRVVALLAVVGGGMGLTWTCAAGADCWDPRNNPCYNARVVDQGQCGDCYAASSAVVFSISACLAGALPSTVIASPEWSSALAQMNLGTVTGNPSGDACGGGDPGA